MGGGNAQKSATARLKNMKDKEKTPEERKAASAKAAADASAFMCKICRTTFMINVKKPTLYLHVTSKHPGDTDPASCFSALQGFDPEDPDGKKAAAAEAAAKKAAPARKSRKNADDGLDLLSVGLKKKSVKKR